MTFGYDVDVDAPIEFKAFIASEGVGSLIGPYCALADLVYVYYILVKQQ